MMDVRAFVRERDKVLIDGDLDRAWAFLRKYSPNMPAPSSREVMEIALHKARTGALSLPVAMRRASAHWLKRRGYQSFDDGDL
jgi:hypothetical protein